MIFKRLLCMVALLLTATTIGASSGQMNTLSIAAGSGHGLALRSDGTVWAWGTNQIGEMGTGGTSSLFPVRIPGLTGITNIAAAGTNSLAVGANGTVWAWGAGISGQLGNGFNANSTIPVIVTGITNAIAVASGFSHSLALLANGKVMSWGTNNLDQLGNNTTTPANQPVFVSNMTNAIKVVAGGNHSAALTVAGEVWCWGYGGDGEIGSGNNSSVKIPVKAAGLAGIVDIAAGSSHMLALKSDGTVWTWGFNHNGELGLGNTANTNLPAQVVGLSGIQSIGAGFSASAVTLSNGQTYVWGFNTATVKLPTPLASSPAFTKLTYGGSLQGFGLGLTSDGQVWAWGLNDNGQFGAGNSFVPGIANFALIPKLSFAATPPSQWGEFIRGNENDLNLCSVVVPIDLEKGVPQNRTGADAYAYGISTPWFLQIQPAGVFQSDSLVNGTTNITRFLVDNPETTFGSQGGGSPMYLNVPYRFGVYAGGFDESTSGSVNAIKISVYDRTFFNGSTNIAPTNTFYITLPRRTVAADSNAWVSFLTNGGTITVETNGLKTTVEFLDTGDPANKPFGLTQLTAPSSFILTGYKLTHSATGTNYFYKVEVLGEVQVDNNVVAQMGTNNAGAWTGIPLYTLDFEQQPALRSEFVDRLFFEGKPLPPTYAGKSLPELSGLITPVTIAENLTNTSAYTNLNASPELRRHPLLDQFVLDMNQDPLALASYVINEIELTDPYAAAQSATVVKSTINCGGVNRSALSTFLEGQGSPIEQCALLVYLLRQAGYYAAYVFPTNGNISLLDTRVSQLWRTQVKGVVNVLGIPYFTNSLITVSYPWVVANIGTNTVHIFPWLKDHEIVEGINLYDYMPTNYNTALKWSEDYVRGNPAILALDSENLPATLFPKFVQQILNTNQLSSRISIDDLGVRSFNRRHQFPDWSYLPQPNVATNLSTVSIVGSLTDSTNTFSFLANIFDTVRVEVYKNSVTTGNLLFNTANWDACDFHDRKLLLFTNSLRLTLWLAPYTPGITTIEAFTNGPSSTAIQSNTVAVAGITNLYVQTVHKRHVATLSTPKTVFPESEPSKGVTNRASCLLGDTAAIALDFGRVTPAMLQPYANTYWDLEAQRATNNSFVPPVQDLQGTMAYLLGMGYFQKLDAFDQINQQYHKIRGLVRFQSGLGVLGSAASPTKMQPKVDMSLFGEVVLAHGSLHPDSSVPYFSLINNYSTLSIVSGSAQEHSILQHMFSDPTAISTVRLLQLAQARATNGNSPVLELYNTTFAAAGSNAYTGYGTNLLQNQNSGLWSSVTNAFGQVGADYARALLTPGMITNQSGSYIGMGALILSLDFQEALITGNASTLNGGWGSLTSAAVPTAPSGDFTFSQNASSSGGFTYSYLNPNNQNTRFALSSSDAASLGGGTQSFTLTSDQTSLANFAAFSLNLSGGTTAMNLFQSSSIGLLGNVSAAHDTLFEDVMDPVNTVSGEFYVDEVDLTLPGPFPLQLRRNYLSQNQAPNEFGYGWKQNFMPYLCLTTNAASQSIILGAELDGAVIAYRLTNGYWQVLTQDNPSLNNENNAGIGATANKFNARLDFYSTNGGTYIITGAEGGQRLYTMNSFPITNGTSILSRSRPYLSRWQDHAGNYQLFSYGINQAASDYGQLNRIDSANGNSLIFKYDFFGRIIQAFTADGRFVRYDYDDYGDLVTVTLPDASQCQYTYDHYTFNTTNTGSDHLLIQEIKPNGRIVANLYDSLRRVTNQSSTVGTNLALVANAFFTYNNNVTNLTNPWATGNTRVEDVFHNPTTYYYTNNLILNTVDALGYSNAQTWFPEGATNLAGYYPRSVQRTVDKRGLTNDFYYDASGNVTQQILRGDLTGEGNSNQTTTNSYTYTAKNMPATITDPVGNISQFLYDSADPFRVVTNILSNAGGNISTNFYAYTNSSQVIAGGRTIYAFGLRSRTVRPGGATNEVAYDGHGYPIQETRYSATTETASSDPSIVTYWAFNARGQLYHQQVSGGATTEMDYDPMGRIKSREVFDQNGTSLSHEFYYYNRNGELEWYDGPRSGPEDLVWYHYDGAGRAIQKTKFRSQAKWDGTGVESPSGYDLYATTFQEFDGFGNVTRTIDPRGVAVTNAWDAIGQLLVQSVLETNGNLLKSEQFTYEPGGQISTGTDALGGVTQTLYTQTGKPRFRRGPDGSTNGWTYYLDGRPKRKYQSNGPYWESTYDDFNRRTVEVFHALNGTALGTNVSEMDRRGNVIRTVDRGGYAFTNVFDGLDRLKGTLGPIILPNTNGPQITTLTPVQHITTNYYGVAGLTHTNVNALSEKSISYSDTLGRVIRSEIRDAANVLVRESTTTYSDDHQSVSVTSGSGATAVTTTTFTDQDNHPVLSIMYPASGVIEFTRSQYDLAGNLALSSHVSSTNGVLTTWTTAAYGYDGLNRMTAQTNRDNAVTLFAHDPVGNLTQRSLPGGVVSWRASYTNSFQLLQEYDLGSGGAGARTNNYVYFGTNSAFAGLLQTRTDGRGVVCTHAYDDWLRSTTLAYTNPASGSPAEQKLTTTYSYDVRGFVTGLTEAFASTNAGPSTVILRNYDPYGLLASENVNVGGVTYSSASQAWDSAGRRSGLGFGTFSYLFGWGADGQLAATVGSSGGGTYSHDTSGQLLTRTFSPRVTSINQRDGAGRPVSVVTTINGTNSLNETLAYTGDGLIASHTVVRPDFTDVRSYSYASQSRRLTQEIVRADASTLWTNSFAYDGGATGGVGTLTGTGPGGTNATWSASVDALARPGAESNNVIQRSVYGRVNGAASLTIALDGKQMPFRVWGTTNGLWTNQWATTLTLTPGAHQLVATAKHPSGLFTTNTVAYYTNNATDTVQNVYSAEGALTLRVWKTGAGSTNRTQTLAWDAKGRLYQVVERDDQTNGFNWQAVFDGLGRRIQTTTTLVTNGTAITGQASTISQYYDPEVEFLELGVTVAGKTTWKLNGPDLDGIYGGLNGTGGLDATVPGDAQFLPTISDARGNIHAFYNVGTSTTVWNTNRPTGYGFVPGFAPPPLGFGGSLVQASAWRGRWMDITGCINLGARPYRPETGAFESYDPESNDGDPNGYSFARGEPISGFDPDGRLATPVGHLGAKTLDGIVNFAVGTFAVPPGGEATPEQTQMLVQNAIRDYGSPMKRLGIDYGASPLVETIAPQMGSPIMNAVNSYGVGVLTSHPVETPLAPEASINSQLLLTYPSRGEINAVRGNAFHSEVYESLRLPENTIKVSGIVDGNAINTEPDLLGIRTGVTDIKDQISLSFDQQLRAQYDYASKNNLTFNLIISSRTQVISQTLQQAINSRGGIIVEFNSQTKSFAPVKIQGNKVIR